VTGNSVQSASDTRTPKGSSHALLMCSGFVDDRTFQMSQIHACFFLSMVDATRTAALTPLCCFKDCSVDAAVLRHRGRNRRNSGSSSRAHSPSTRPVNEPASCADFRLLLRPIPRDCVPVSGDGWSVYQARHRAIHEHWQSAHDHRLVDPGA
jgi:hypothetical protein